MSDQHWYFGEDGQQRGPVSLGELRDRVARGQTRGSDLVWREGMADWVPAGTLPELADLLRGSGAMPPPPPPPPGYAGGPPPGMVPPPGFRPHDAQAIKLQSRANTALVLGICSIVFGPCCCSPVGIGLGVAAIVMGRNARNAPNPGSATAGFICGIVGLLLSVGALGLSATNLVMHPNQRMHFQNGRFVMPNGM